MKAGNFFKFASFCAVVMDASRRLKRLEAIVSDLTSAEQRVEDQEAALETRVTAHEQLLEQAKTELLGIKAELEAKLSAQDTTVQRLSALSDRIGAFDPDQAASTDTTSTGSVNTAAPATDPSGVPAV